MFSFPVRETLGSNNTAHATLALAKLSERPELVLTFVLVILNHVTSCALENVREFMREVILNVCTWI